MALLKVGYRMMQSKASYFDRKPIIDKLDKATRRVLSKFGAFVRTRDITSMLRHNVPRGFGVKTKVSNRDGVSPVDTPPYPHVGTMVKNVEFSYDEIAHSVVVGPALIVGKTGTRNALHAMEYSGPSLMKSTNRATKGQLLPIFVKARPSINPAFEAEKPRLPQMWKDAMDKV